MQNKRFVLFSWVASIVAAASAIMAVIGFMAFEARHPAYGEFQDIFASMLIAFGFLGILAAGAVHVLIAIYDEIAAASGKVVDPGAKVSGR